MYRIQNEKSSAPVGSTPYTQTVGEDGFFLLETLDAPETPEVLRLLPRVETLGIKLTRSGYGNRSFMYHKDTPSM